MVGQLLFYWVMSTVTQGPLWAGKPLSSRVPRAQQQPEDPTGLVRAQPCQPGPAAAPSPLRPQRCERSAGHSHLKGTTAKLRRPGAAVNRGWHSQAEMGQGRDRRVLRPEGGLKFRSKSSNQSAHTCTHTPVRGVTRQMGNLVDKK